MIQPKNEAKNEPREFDQGLVDHPVAENESKAAAKSDDADLPPKKSSYFSAQTFNSLVASTALVAVGIGIGGIISAKQTQPKKLLMERDLRGKKVPQVPVRSRMNLYIPLKCTLISNHFLIYHCSNHSVAPRILLESTSFLNVSCF